MSEKLSVANRRKAREIALHVIFERSFDLDSVNGILTNRLTEEAFDSLKGETEVYESVLPVDECVYIRTLTEGIEAQKPLLAQAIQDHSHNWKLGRISRISRSILEIALYEILFMDDIDTSVSINEAVELAKKYDTEDAGAFINGVLGGYVKAGTQEAAQEQE